jgi:hypothetical protein
LKTSHSAPLNRTEFLAQCLWRNPEFRRFVVRIWQELPPVFRRRTVDDEETDLFARVAEAETVKSGRVVLRVKTFDNLVRAMHVVRAMSAVAGLRPIAFASDEYCDALDVDRSACTQQFRVFQEEAARRWPRWVAGRLCDPHELNWWDARPEMVVRKALVPPASWPMPVRTSRKGIWRASRIWIPIYEDTGDGDLNWPLIADLQERVYGKKRRKHPDQYRALLDVFDAYEVNKRSFAEIAAARKTAVSTIKSQYLTTRRLIMGDLSKKAVREAFLSDGRSHHDTEKCPQCSSAKRFEDLCPAVRDCADADQLAG